MAGCSITDLDQAQKATKTMQTVGGDYRQGSEQIDASAALLEKLVKTGSDRHKKGI